jgi:taurine dioxygenase
VQRGSTWEKTVEFRALHEDFGVEVSGFDVFRSSDPADIAALKRARDQYQLLVFRCDEEMPPERQIEVTGWFGPIMNAIDGGIGFLSNEEGQIGGRERLPFHFDYSFTETPFSGISLQAVALPPAGTTTLFTSNVVAWESLTSDLPQRLMGLTARHRDAFDAVSGAPELAADHRVCTTHPRTGKKLLWISECHTQRLLELGAKESDALLEELYAHIYARERIYEHRWALHDFLLWDNYAIQHCRPVEADPADGIRSLRRATNSEFSLGEILERARQRTADLLGAE